MTGATGSRDGATARRRISSPFAASLRHGGALLLAVLGCRGTLSPLSNKLDVGQESYFVFVADGEEGLGDLFAAAPVGGEAYQFTFTRLDERAPALSPDGVVVAFLRSRKPGDGTAADVVMMNLLNGAERAVAAPAGTSAVAWSRDGTRLFLREPGGLRMVNAPPGASTISPVDSTEFPAADSAFKVLLGDPPIGEAVACEQGGICALLPSGTTVLSADGHSVARWGSDSLIYASGSDLVIRPLAGGATRVLKFSRDPVRPRQPALYESR